MLKLQSAIEYLTTYGWAILIIAVALVVLFELGIFNRAPPTQCILEGGFGCSDYYLTTNGVLVFNLEQQTTNPVNITGIACYENSTLLSGQKPYNPPSNQIFMPVGSADTFYVQCYTTNTLTYSGNIGSTFTGTLAIYYTDAITHYTELVKGSLIVPVSTNEQIVQQSSLSSENSIPITITDTTSYAIPAGFQEMLSINPTSYQIYGLNQNFSNVEFTTGQDGSGVPIYAWIESGASNTASNTIIWLKLPSGITSNGGTETVYMNFLTNNDPVTSGYTGYAPQLWCASGCFQTSYAQYDNGGNVFNFYNNFAGTTLSSLISSPSEVTATQDNGLYLSATASNDGGIVLINQQETLPYIFQSLVTNQNIDGSPNIQEGLLIDSNTNIGFNTAGSPQGTNYFFRAGNGGFYQMLEGSALLVAYTSPIITTPYTSMETFTQNSIGLTSFDDGYTLTASTTSLTSGYLGFWFFSTATGGGVLLQYIRVRNYPPNGVMPPATIGN